MAECESESGGASPNRTRISEAEPITMSLLRSPSTSSMVAAEKPAAAID